MDILRGMGIVLAGKGEQVMSETRSAWKGFLAGAIGGAIGTLVLNLFQQGSLEGTRVVEGKLGGRKRFTREQEQLLKGFEQAHVQTAETLGIDVPRTQRKKAAAAVEFGFGILCGGAYGALAEYVPAARAGFGTVYGATLFTGASEIVLPALGWVAAPQDRTVVQHVGGLAGNVVYGAVTEGVRLGLRQLV